MILYYQTHSPFARKVLVFAHEVGIAGQLKVIHHETSPTLRNARVYAENPLGKVPVLLRPDATPIFDSDVICAYLDILHGGRKLLPQDGEARWQALRLRSVAQGLAQAGIALRWETERRPEQLRYDALAEGYRGKIEASYDWIESALDDQALPNVGHVALATTLSWIEFRHLPSFRSRGRLTRWYEAFEKHRCGRRRFRAIRMIEGWPPHAAASMRDRLGCSSDTRAALTVEDFRKADILAQRRW